MNFDKVNIGVYCGRFSPFHKAHEEVVKNALARCDILIIVFGSHSIMKTQRDPWLAIERIEMVKSCFNEDELKKIKFYPIINYGNINSWIADIMVFIANFKNEGDTLGLFGCIKDESSSYLNDFPICFKKMFSTPFYDGMSATDIRNKYFNENIIEQKSLPKGVIKYLENYTLDFNYRSLPVK